MVDDAFEAYQKATGATLDNTTGLLTINPTQYKQLHNLSILVSNVIISTTQCWNHHHINCILFFLEIRLNSNSQRTLKSGLASLTLPSVVLPVKSIWLLVTLVRSILVYQYLVASFSAWVSLNDSTLFTTLPTNELDSLKLLSHSPSPTEIYSNWKKKERTIQVIARDALYNLPKIQRFVPISNYYIHWGITMITIALKFVSMF